MKTSIKTTISIIAIAISSITFAQAGQNRHERGSDHNDDRGYVAPRHQRHYRHNERTRHWTRVHNRHDRYRHKRHHRKHHYSKYRNWDRPYWKRSHRRVEKHVYHHNRYSAPRHSVSRVIVRDRHHRNNALPVIAGGLIGSSIANNVSHGDPVATVGGAVFGAIIGNAISHH